MMKFIIQTISDEVVHDFSFELLRSIDYLHWKGNQTIDVTFLSLEGIKKLNLPKEREGYVPVGTVQFVHGIMKHYGIPVPGPINVPHELCPYRPGIFNGTHADATGDLFVKSRDEVKALDGGIYKSDELKPGNYQFSPVEDILSEYRCFVYKNELVGIQHYSGDYTIFPMDVDKIKKMIDDYTSAPVSYTLDIGIISGEGYNALTKYKIIPIEVHNFYSVGFYGFSNYNIIPYMFYRWYINYN